MKDENLIAILYPDARMISYELYRFILFDQVLRYAYWC